MIITLLFLVACNSSVTKPNTDGPHIIDDTSTDDTADTVIVDTGEPDPDSGLDDTDTGTAPSTPYNLAYFKSMHNAYSGEERGTIHEQLDAGFRGLEFDIHDNEFANIGDYQLGHFSPGGEVERGHGNPSTVLLSDWLSHVKAWSSENQGHAPITITIDFKDDLTDNINHMNGSMDKLNDIFVSTLGNAIFAPMYFAGEWPSVDELRNRFVLVLSGHEESRQLYKRDRGHHPAVAINDSGQVIEVHDSGSGSLWYWTGQMRSDGSVEWKRHGRYDSGQKPAIALNNDGWFVEVHQSESNTTLWYRTGQLDSDYNPVFQNSEQYDDGVEPTIRFTSKNSSTLLEIHKSQSTGLHWDWSLTLNQISGEISWGAHGQTSTPLHDKDRDSAVHWIEVLTEQHQNAGSDTLLYETRFDKERIRYPQIAFVEYQNNNSTEIIDGDAWFAAIGSGSESTLTSWNNDGFITRVWGFDEGDTTSTNSPPNFPATDYLDAGWYNSYCTRIGTVE